MNNKKNIKNIICSCLFGLILITTSNKLQAIDPYDTLPYPTGLYYVNYTSYANADTVYNHEGKKALENINFNQTQNVFRMAYFNNKLLKNTFLVNAALPVMKSTYGSIEESGIGDLVLSGSYWAIEKPENLFWLSTGLYTKAPVGNNDTTSIVGTNRYEIRPYFTLTKNHNRFQGESAIGYSFFTENKETKVKEGARILLENYLGYNISPKNLAGLHFNAFLGKDSHINGTAVNNTAITRYQGGLSYLHNFGNAKTISIEYFYDLKVKNTIKTNAILIRTSYLL